MEETNSDILETDQVVIGDHGDGIDIERNQAIQGDVNIGNAECDENDSDSDTEYGQNDEIFQDNVSSTGDDESDDVDGNISYFLSSWASQNHITHSALQSLLAFLKPHHHCLPKDPRTLLNTKITYDVANMGDGSYHHFGIKESVLNEVQTNSPFALLDIDSINIQLNIDGLPLFKSSSTQFWPILG